jgi:hypothetical protein
MNWQNFFEFSHAEIESQVENKDGSYKNIRPEALYTSYQDLETIFSYLGEAGTWVDLGAGIGVSALMYAYLYPDRKAYALEFVRSRIEAGIKIKEEKKLPNAVLLNQDLLHCEIPQGDTYFLYFPTGPVLDRILSWLYLSKSPFRLVAIESHGDLLNRLGKESWLVPVGEIALSQPRHHSHAIIYEANWSLEIQRSRPHEISFQQKLLLIDQQWWGESFGLEWLEGDHYNLKIPPRTIAWEQVSQIVEWNDLDCSLRFSLQLRRLGPLVISTCAGDKEGSLRKIYSSPCFSVELSTGEQLEWKNILTIHWNHILCYDSSSDYFFLPPAPSEL